MTKRNTPAPPALPEECCGKCRFYHPEFICRRYPPQLMIDGSSRFPPMQPIGWCGEYKK